MPEEVIRITVDTAQGAAAMQGFNDIVARTNAQMERLNASTWRFQNISQTMNASGQVMKTTAAAISQEGDKVTTTMTNMENAAGRGSRSMGFMARELRNIGAAIVIWQGFRMVTDTINEMHDAQAALSGEVVRFGLITGQSLGDARNSYLALQAVTTAQGILPEQAAPAIIQTTRIGGPGGEDFLRATSIYSNLFKVDMAEASKVFTAALQQQNLTMESSMDVLDQFIAVARQSPQTIVDLSDAMTEAPNIMQKFNLGFTQMLGLMAEVGGASGETANVVAGTMTRIGDSVSRLEGQKALDFAGEFHDMRISVQDDAGNFLDPVQLIMNVAQAFDTLTTAQQSKVFEMLGLLKPQYQQVGRALMQALADGQIGNLEVIENAGRDVGDAWVNAFTGQIQRSRALQQEVYQTQSGAAAIASTVTQGALEFLGRPDLATNFQTNLLTRQFPTSAGQNAKDAFLRSIMGLSDEEARRAINDWNDRVKVETRRQREGMGLAIFDPFAQARVSYVEKTLKFESADAGIARLKELEKQASLTADAISKMSAEQKQSALEIAQAIPFFGKFFQGFEIPAEAPVSPTTTGGGGGYNPLRDQFIQMGAESLLGSNAIDASTFSQDEFNSALRESEEIYAKITQARIEEMQAAGLTADQIDAEIAKIQEKVDMTYVLVELEGQRLEYIRGAAALHLQEVLRERERAKKEEERAAKSDFAFRRLRDVEPSQFPQLQALSQMYNQFLTNIGSPEESKNINLLLGEENVFKNMNVRMTALQLALEDLTKVEKAQLSGTWNLPAGATALVPISSLDIQRWNSQGGGGMSAEDIMALLGAEQASGDQVSSAIDSSTQAIVAAILEGRMTLAEGVQAADDPKAMALALAQSVRDRASEQRITATSEIDRIVSAIRAAMTSVRQTRPMVEDGGETYRGSPPPARGSRRGIIEPRYDPQGYEPVARRTPGLQHPTAQQLEAAVTVNPMPLKATLTANIVAQINGMVLFRVVQQMLYSQLVRMSRSGPGNTSTRDLGSLR